jgi:NADH dehydrogenase
MTKNIVVVGAGYSGVFAARKLGRQLAGNTEYQVVLIDKHSFFTYMTELHEVATKRVEPKHIQFDLEQLFHGQKNVKVVTAEVTGFDKVAKSVTTSAGVIPYEKLVLATGGTTNTFGTPGVAEYGYTLWSYEEALRLRQHIEQVINEGARELDPVKRAAKLSIVVVGSGFTGVELAGELIDQRKELAEANFLAESEITLTVVEAAPSILNMLTDRKLADKAEHYMTKHGLRLLKATGVTAVKEDAAVLADGSEIPTETLVWTAGVKAKEQGSQWGLQTGPAGRFLADDYSRAVGEEDIYVAGDVAAYQEPARTIPDNPRSGWTPQTVEGGESAANTVVPNIMYDLTGKGVRKMFRGHYQGFAVSVGSHYAVAYLYDKVPLAGFLANLIKHGINFYFFLQIMSVYHIFHYAVDEFFRTPNERTPFHGHSSRLGNVLWAVPLRIVTGASLIVTGTALSGTFGTWFVILGLLLVFGLFTSIAGFFTFLTTIVLIAAHPSLSALILPFAGLALMNGAGRALGLDHYLMPYLMKKIGGVLNGKMTARYDDLHK